MKIERIYVAGFRKDLRYTRCCVASIRRWYPDIPIALLKNENQGSYDTSDIERYWDVECFHTGRTRFRGGMAKLEPLVQPKRERYFIIDSDTVFLGRVLGAIDGFTEDFVVNAAPAPEQVERHMFRTQRLRVLDPDFDYQGHAFNTGHYIATSGLIDRAEFDRLLTIGEPQELLYPDIFCGTDQGILNYVVLKKVQQGRITLAGWNMMWWTGEPSLRIDPSRLDDGSAYPYILHWAGPKHPWFRQMAYQAVLDLYERYYYSRIPNGGRRRAQAVLAEGAREPVQRLKVRSRKLKNKVRSSVFRAGRTPKRVARSARVRLRRLVR